MDQPSTSTANIEPTPVRKPSVVKKPIIDQKLNLTCLPKETNNYPRPIIVHTKESHLSRVCASTNFSHNSNNFESLDLGNINSKLFPRRLYVNPEREDNTKSNFHNLYMKSKKFLKGTCPCNADTLSYFNRIMKWKSEVLRWDLKKKRAKLGLYSACLAKCVCHGWRLSRKDQEKKKKLSDFNKICKKCPHPLEIHCNSDLTENEVNFFLNLAIDAEYMLSEVKHHEDSEEISVLTYLSEVIGESIYRYQSPEFILEMNNFPFEIPNIFTATQNLIEYNRKDKPNVISERVQHCLNLILKILDNYCYKPPSELNHVTNPEEVIFYKLIYNRWYILCRCPLFFTSFQRYNPTDLFGKDFYSIIIKEYYFDIKNIINEDEEFTYLVFDKMIKEFLNPLSPFWDPDFQNRIVN